MRGSRARRSSTSIRSRSTGVTCGSSSARRPPRCATTKRSRMKTCRLAEGLSRDGDRLLAVAKDWYDSVRPGTEPKRPEIAGLDNVLLQSMRPFLTRAAEAIMARIDFAGWQRGTCPLCSGEPDLAVITPAAERILICARCNARWRFHQLTCPFCLNADRSRSRRSPAATAGTGSTPATCAPATSRRTTHVRRRDRCCRCGWSGDAAAGRGSDAEGL